MTVAIIVAGCGGSAKPKGEIVAGTGFRFSAPAGWTIKRAGTTVTAAQGGGLVRVSTFPLARPYSPALFPRVAGELKARMTALAAHGGGKVAGTGEAVAAGIKAHVWRIRTGTTSTSTPSCSGAGASTSCSVAAPRAATTQRASSS